MTIRVIREGSAPHDARLRVRDVIAALVELGSVTAAAATVAVESNRKVRTPRAFS